MSEPELDQLVEQLKTMGFEEVGCHTCLSLSISLSVFVYVQLGTVPLHTLQLHNTAVFKLKSHN